MTPFLAKEPAEMINDRGFGAKGDFAAFLGR
jgi:hypothetical protein